MMTQWLGLPPLASANGGEIDSLIGWMHIFMFVLFIGWGAFLTYCLVRFRRSRNPVASYAGVKTHTSSYLEVAVAVIEAICCRLLHPALGREGRPPSCGERSGGRPGHRRAVRVEHPLSGPRRGIRPHEHDKIRRPVESSGPRSFRPRAKDDVTTTNQLNLPVNRPVIVRLQEQGRHSQLRRTRDFA
jgi:cytochrome c oxidase subunit 2